MTVAAGAHAGIGSVETSSLRWATGRPAVQPKHTDSSKEVEEQATGSYAGSGDGRRVGRMVRRQTWRARWEDPGSGARTVDVQPASWPAKEDKLVQLCKAK
jgi:hypothetical protein